MGKKFCTKCGQSNSEATSQVSVEEATPQVSNATSSIKQENLSQCQSVSPAMHKTQLELLPKRKLPITLIAIAVVFMALGALAVIFLPKLGKSGLPDTTLDIMNMPFEKKELDKQLEKIGYIVEGKENPSDSEEGVKWKYQNDKPAPLFLGSAVSAMETWSIQGSGDNYISFIIDEMNVDAGKASDIMPRLDKAFGKRYTSSVGLKEGKFARCFWMHKERGLFLYINKEEDTISTAVIMEMKGFEEFFVDTFGAEDWRKWQEQHKENSSTDSGKSKTVTGVYALSDWSQQMTISPDGTAIVVSLPKESTILKLTYKKHESESTSDKEENYDSYYDFFDAEKGTLEFTAIFQDDFNAFVYEKNYDAYRFERVE